MTEVIGHPPKAGQHCSGLLVMHFMEGWRITDQVNVAFFCLDELWKSLCFEYGTVFWRDCLKPESPENGELGTGLLLNDLSALDGIVGSELKSIQDIPYGDGDFALVVEFGTGKFLEFKYSGASDSTNIIVGGQGRDSSC